MKWDECMHVSEALGLSRFSWPIGDGINGFDCKPLTITINDFFGVIGWVWTWPGDWLLSSPEIQTFFDMEQGVVIGSWWSTALIWGVLFGLVSLIGQQR